MNENETNSNNQNNMATNSVVEPKSTIEPVQPVTESIIEPVVETSVTETVVEPVVEETVVEPTVEAVVEPIAEPVVEEKVETPVAEATVVEGPTTIYEEVEVKHKEYLESESTFDGKLIELIGYNILSFIITIFSLTIASAWGKCLVMSYKVNHTIVNGRRLKFEGTGASLFVNRLKWIFFTLITFGIYAFWIPIKQKKWELSNIHFEDEPHVTMESFFDGNLMQLVLLNFACGVLNTLTLGLAYPLVSCIRLRWLNKHAVINKKKLIFKGTAGSLYLHYLLWSFLTVITFGIYGLWLKINLIKWQVKNTHIKRVDENYKKDGVMWIFVIALIIFSLGATIVGSVANSMDLVGKLEEFYAELTGSSDYEEEEVVDPIIKNVEIIKTVRTSDDQILVFIKNNNDFAVDITARSEYKIDGERVSTKSGYIYAIDPGYESIVIIKSPNKHFEKYEISINAKETRYVSALDQVTYNAQHKSNIKATAKSDIHSIKMGMIYYSNGVVVDCSTWEFGLGVGSHQLNMALPTVSFDSYEPILIEAYNKK